MRGKVIAVLFVLGILSILLPVLACAPRPPTKEPALPVGFQQTLLPTIPLSGYLYISQKSPISLFDPYGPYSPLKFKSVRFWLGSPSVTGGGKEPLFGIGFSLNFVSISDARRFAKEGEPTSEVSVIRVGSEVFILPAGTPFEKAILELARMGKGQSLSEKEPEIYDLLQFLLAQPPHKPLGAGFLKADIKALEPLVKYWGISPEEVFDLIERGKIDFLGFAVYAKEPVKIDLSPGDAHRLKENKVSSLIVTRLGYPSFAVSAVFPQIMEDTGLERTLVGNRTVYYIVHYVNSYKIHIFVRNEGNLVYIAVAPSRPLGEQLIVYT